MSGDGKSSQTLEEFWISEGLLFARFFLGNNSQAQELVERLILDLLPVNENCTKARFFKELEECAIQFKNTIQSNTAKQMELFPADVEEASEGKNIREVKIARARAFLVEVHGGATAELSDSTVRGDEQFIPILCEFVKDIYPAKFKNEQKTSTSLQGEEFKLVVSYALECLIDDEAMEVERKCRQHPDWQTLKVCAGNAITWIEQAVDNLENVEGMKMEPEREKRILERMEELDAKQSHTSSLPRPTEKEHPVKRIKKRNDFSKDKVLMTWLVTGLFVTMIGYFGWKEKTEKIKFEKEKPVQSSEVNESLFAEGNWSQVAMLAAEKSARLILDKSLTHKIDKMEKEMTIPPNLILPESSSEEASPEKAQEVVPIPESKLIPSSVELHGIIQASEGFLFLPNLEALGRVVDLNFTDEYVGFTRGDWPNPNRSYALPVSDYELRVGDQETGYFILFGQVTRGEVGGESTRARYHMSPSQIWWLDANQSRREIDLTFFNSLF
jgi:hypothetical protein